MKHQNIFESITTVRDLIRELLNYDLDDDVVISIDDKEKIGQITELKRFKGMCEIHFNNWTKEEADGSSRNGRTNRET